MNIELSKATQDGVVLKHTVQLCRHPSMNTEETRRARVVRVVGRRTDKGASNNTMRLPRAVQSEDGRVVYSMMDSDSAQLRPSRNFYCSRSRGSSLRKDTMVSMLVYNAFIPSTYNNKE